MPQRLRDLIVEQRNALAAPDTALSNFAEQMASDRLAAAEAAAQLVADPERTKQAIIAQASEAMLAQATHTRASAVALLQAD